MEGVESQAKWLAIAQIYYAISSSKILIFIELSDSQLKGNFASRGHLLLSGDSFDCYHFSGGGCSWHLVGRCC